MWKTDWILGRKDLRLFLRDRTGMLLSLALPVFLATIFGAAMGGMGGKSKGVGRVELLVEDLDRSASSKELIAELEKSDGLKIECAEDVRKKITAGKAAAALLIPSGYGVDVDHGRMPKLALYRDPAQNVEQQIIAGNLLPVLFKQHGPRLGRSMAHRAAALFGFSPEALPQAERILDQTFDSMVTIATSKSAQPSDGAVLDLDKDTGQALDSNDAGFDFAHALPELAGIEVEDVAGGEDTSQKSAMQSHAVSGIAVMMLLFGLVACGGTLLEEHASGTLQRLQLSPTSTTAILLGKFMYTGVVGSVQLALLFAYGALIFDVPVMRDPLALAIVSFAVVCAATGLGIFLAVTCRTRKQLEGLSTLIILVMSALGGSWFPLIVTPQWFQRLGHFTLNAWAMDAYQGIFWYGKGLAGVWLDVLVLVAIAAGTTWLAMLGWRRRFEVAT